jgi:hypothetical protein
MKRINGILILLMIVAFASCGPAKSSKSPNLPASYSEDLSGLRDKGKPVIETKEVVEITKPPFVNPTSDVTREVNMVLDSLTSQNKSRGFIEGYSVQVYSGGSRTLATETRLRIMESNEEINPEITYEQPNYKVKIGFYAERVEALKIYHLLKPTYPSTLIVPERRSLRNE